MPYNVAARNAEHRESAARWLRAAGVPDDLAGRIARRLPGREAKALGLIACLSVEDAKRIGGLVQRLYDAEQERERLRAALEQIGSPDQAALRTSAWTLQELARAALRKESKDA